MILRRAVFLQQWFDLETMFTNKRDKAKVTNMSKLMYLSKKGGNELQTCKGNEGVF